MSAKANLESVISRITTKTTIEAIPPAPESSPTDHRKIAAAMERIVAAGFEVKLLPGDKLVVSPRAKLSEAQVGWITANKPAIMAYLRTHTQQSDVKAIQSEFKATIQSVAMESLHDPSTSPESYLVSCQGCSSGQRFMPGDDYGQWRLCDKGLGAHYAIAHRTCEGFVRVGAH
jgi:hypothetical protein